MKSSEKSNAPIIPNKKKAKHEDEFVIAKNDKANHADELGITLEKKAKRADELVIAKADKAEREAELKIANEEKTARGNELVIAKAEKAEREAELVIAKAEKAKRAAELVIAMEEKSDRADELVIANAEKAKRAEELIIANKELTFQKGEKGKRAEELIGAKIKIVIQGEENEKIASELIIANLALVFQKELIEAKEKAEESEKKFKLLYENAPLSYQSLDTNACLIDVNPTWLQTLGYKREEVIGRPFGDFMTIESAELIKERFTSVEKGEIHNYEFEMVRKDGTRFMVSYDGKIGYDELGHFYKTHCIFIDITDRKQAEKEREQFFSFFNLSPDIMVIADTNGTFKAVNPAATKLLGYSEEELISKPFIEFVHPDDKRITLDEMARQMKIGSTLNFENRYLSKNDRYVLLSWCAYFNKEEGITYATARDITTDRMVEVELIKAKEKAERNEKELKKAQQITHIGSWYLDIKTNEVVWTEELYKMFGFDPLLPLPPYTEHQKLFTAESWEILSTSLANTRETGIPYELELQMVKEDGSNGWLWARGEEVLDKENKIIGIWGAAQDITERKINEENLKKIVKDLQESQHLAKIGSWDWDIKSDIITWSEELYKIFGFENNQDPPGYKEHLKIYAPESIERLDKAVKNTMQTGEPYELDLKSSGNYGTIGWVTSRCLPTFNINGEIISLHGTIQDITEKKESEIELIKAKERAEESDRLKSAFLANMSHEIRTPMNGILGFAGLLKEPGLNGEDQQEYIRIIEKSGARMLNIINDIVDISKIESGLMEISRKETNINEQMEYVYTFFKPETESKELQLLLKKKLSIEEAIITTDREKIYAILTNLVKNAIKYTNKGLIEFGCDKKGDKLEFFVKDTGIGIANNRQEAIFERFIQADISDIQALQGAGLGLSISKAYVELLEGRMWLESQEGKGSTFYFTIPHASVLEEKTVIGDTSSEKDIESQTKKIKILIVEDDEVSHSLLTLMLQKVNCEVLHAITGVEAVDASRKNPDIDLVLMDIRMPKMDGNEATRQIRQFNKDVIIVAQTAYAFSGDKEKAIEAGCNDYITKPIKRKALIDLVESYF